MSLSRGAYRVRSHSMDHAICVAEAQTETRANCNLKSPLHTRVQYSVDPIPNTVSSQYRTLEQERRSLDPLPCTRIGARGKA